MFPISLLKQKPIHHMFKNNVLRNCKCCNKPIKHLFKNNICLICKNFYRQQCMFFGIKVKNISRFQLCDLYMANDKMTCRNIPSKLQKSFDLDLNKAFYTSTSHDNYYWCCNRCNYIANCAFDFFSNKNCSNNYFSHYFFKVKK